MTEQPSMDPLTPGVNGWFSDELLNYATYENFSGLGDSITDLYWWGVEYNYGLCTRTSNTYQITFYEDNAGQPGAMSTQSIVTPKRTPTGRIFSFGDSYPEYLFHARLSAPVNLPAGWVSILGIGDAACGFAWLTSSEGDNLSFQGPISGGVTVTNHSNLSLCLSHEEELCTVLLDGAQEVPPSGSTAAGTAIFSLLPPDTVRLTVIHDVADPTAAHIHSGAPGVNGPVVLDLGAALSPIEITMTLAQYAEFSTDHYVNIHSMVFPEGDIRGDIACLPIEGEGGVEGEGAVEGEGTAEGGLPSLEHSADPDGNGIISLSELLRVIQFFNSGGFHCQAGTEDGYAPGPGDESCLPHSSDYNEQDWHINLSELLRLIQFFNSGGYHACPGENTEDGFCPGPA